jgi:hypothetical protein
MRHSRPRSAMHVRGAAGLLVSALVLAGCSAGATTTPKKAGAGAVSAQPSVCGTCLPAGAYTPSAFVVPLTLTIPGQTWEAGEESYGEFKIHLAADSHQELKFLPQPVPVHNPDLSPVHRVGSTPDSLAAWLRSNPALVVKHEFQQDIGSGTSATGLDVGVRPRAQNSDPGCPAGLSPCVTFFRFFRAGSYDFNLAIANHQTVRLLLAPIALSGRAETMLIVLDPGTPGHLEPLAQRANPLLKTLVLPAS